MASRKRSLPRARWCCGELHSDPSFQFSDESAIQMLSAWIAENRWHCAIKIGLWQGSGRDEARAWGMFRADTIRHIANALQERHDQSAPDSIVDILDSLRDGLDDPTSDVQAGGFSRDHG
jgi:hypothetical protein